LTTFFFYQKNNKTYKVEVEHKKKITQACPKNTAVNLEKPTIAKAGTTLRNKINLKNYSNHITE
jgi:hypothetical protein